MAVQDNITALRGDPEFLPDAPSIGRVVATHRGREQPSGATASDVPSRRQLRALAPEPRQKCPRGISSTTGCNYVLFSFNIIIILIHRYLLTYLHS